MTAHAKVLIPNKVWILEEEGTKLGTLNKETKGYSFYRNGVRIDMPDITQFGTDILKKNDASSKKIEDPKVIYGYPCKTIPFNAIYNVVKKLPIYTKSQKSKSYHCAGYYIIKFKNIWVKSFSPKLITLERYPFKGPYKDQSELKEVLSKMNSNESN